jgi:hypothetical protein
MNPDREQWHQETRAALDECFEQIRFARAAELARSGRYLEAEGLLSPNGHCSEVPRDLDLLARIAVHQGHISDARRLWELALQKDPQNSSYKACIERLAEPRRIRISFDAVLIWIVCIAIAFGVAAFLYVFLSRK